MVIIGVEVTIKADHVTAAKKILELIKALYAFGPQIVFAKIVRFNANEREAVLPMDLSTPSGR